MNIQSARLHFLVLNVHLETISSESKFPNDKSSVRGDSVNCECTVTASSSSFHWICEMAPRGKRLTDVEKGQIIAFNSCGKSKKAIARDLDRSEDLIRRFLADPSAYGTKKSTGQPKKLSPEDESRVEEAASNTLKSCETIKRELSLNVSRHTVWRTISKNPNIVRSNMQKAPKLTENHKVRRLEFAGLNMTQKWEWVSCNEFHRPYDALKGRRQS